MPKKKTKPDPILDLIGSWLDKDTRQMDARRIEIRREIDRILSAGAFTPVDAALSLATIRTLEAEDAIIAAAHAMRLLQRQSKRAQEAESK